MALAASGWIARTSINVNRDTLSNYEILNEEVRLVSEIKSTVDALDAYAQNVLSFNEVIPERTIQREFSNFDNALRSLLGELRQTATDEALEPGIDALDAAYDQWMRALSVSLGLVQADQIPSRFLLADLLEEVHAAEDHVRDHSVLRAEIYGVSAREDLIIRVNTAFAVIALVLLCSSIFVFFRGAWLARTLDQLSNAIDDIRGGDFNRKTIGGDRVDEIGKISRGIEAFAETLDELSKTKERIEHLAMHDAMTTLPNRTKLLEFVDWLMCDDSAKKFALLHIDLDRFKEVNDTHGHAAGDAILRMAANAMGAALGKREIAARIGGDEFILVMEAVDEEVVGDFAQSLIDNISRPYKYGTADLIVGASIGIAYSDSAINAEQLLANADVALYLAKGRGRGNYQFFNAESGREFAKRTELARDLHSALDNGEIHAFYQPQVDWRTRKVIGAEALVRWQHPTHGLLSPTQFLDLVEEHGLGDRLMELVSLHAIDTILYWRNAGFDIPNISVNFNARQIRNTGLHQYLQECIEEAGLTPKELSIEVVESVLLGEHSTEEIQQLVKLQERGFKVQLDDFGTGYASISSLNRFKFDKIKIDREFVGGVACRSDEILVRTIIDLCKNLGVESLAEGVENFEQCNRLAEIGCHLFQGFFICRPLSREDVLDWYFSWENGSAMTG